MVVTLSDDGKVMGVEGNFCKRGVTYANDECTNPKRTVTSTVRCKSGAVLPVKTDKTVPKEKMFEVMEAINSVVAEDGLKIGDIIIEGVCGTDANVVATANM
jgi:CxxC motif-containing protein